MESLNLLARFQAAANGEDMLREPYYRGEIPHEIRTEGTVYYYSADATPLFVIACKKYLDWTKDANFVKFLYNNIVNAIEWSIDADRDGDGLIEHGPEGFLIDTTWMDSYYRGKSALDVQSIYCKALFDGSKIASSLGDDSHATEWFGRANKVKSLLVDKFWDKRGKFFFDTIEPNGEPNRAISVNSILPVLFGLLDENRVNDVLSKIESSDFMTDWGVRTRAKSDPEYDPRSYQKGGVWPFCTGWLTRADFENGKFAEGLANIRRFIAGLGMGSNYFKEVLFGDMPPTGLHPVQPTGCFIQAWSASMFLSSIVEGLLGITPNEEMGANLRIVPYLKPEWEKIEVRNIRVGENTLHYSASQSDNMIRLKVLNNGPEVAQIESGFVLPTNANFAKIIEGGNTAEQISQSKSSDYLKTKFEIRLAEGESKQFRFTLTQ
jgi:glycogen debranching enzyme